MSHTRERWRPSPRAKQSDDEESGEEPPLACVFYKREPAGYFSNDRFNSLVNFGDA